MPFKQVTPIVLSELQLDILERLAHGRTTESNIKRRAKILILASTDLPAHKIAEKMNVSRPQVLSWRNRFLAAEESLLNIETHEPKKLKAAIKAFLKDNPRSGKTPTITSKQKAEIIALACQSPLDLGYPFTQWSHELLAEKAVERGIVPTISSSHVGRFLKSAGIKTTPNTDMD